MPSALGVYSLPPGYLAVTGTTIQASQHNPPLEDIAAALTLRLSRDGTAPMTGPLQHASGTVSLPGAVFAVDPTSGLYKTTNGIGVAIGGTKVAEFLPGGITGARLIGELISFTGVNAPPLWVLPNGQTLSRTALPDLWTFAQAQIGASNPLYNNGDGSTTFGIPDLRGRVTVASDSLGVSSANRTTNATMTPSGTQFGSVGGQQQIGLTQTMLPAVNIAVSGTTSGYGPTSGGGAALAIPNGTVPVAFSASGGNATYQSNQYSPVAGFASLSVTANTSPLGNGTLFTNMQPSIITNYLLYAGG